LISLELKPVYVSLNFADSLIFLISKETDLFGNFPYKYVRYSCSASKDLFSRLFYESILGNFPNPTKLFLFCIYFGKILAFNFSNWFRVIFSNNFWTVFVFVISTSWFWIAANFAPLIFVLVRELKRGSSEEFNSEIKLLLILFFISCLSFMSLRTLYWSFCWEWLGLSVRFIREHSRRIWSKDFFAPPGPRKDRVFGKEFLLYSSFPSPSFPYFSYPFFLLLFDNFKVSSNVIFWHLLF